MNRIQASLSSALLLATSIFVACSQNQGNGMEPSGTSNGSGSMSSGSGRAAGSSTGSWSGIASGASGRSGAATGSASGQSGKGTASGSSAVSDASLDSPSQEMSDGGPDDPAAPPNCITPTTVQT